MRATSRVNRAKLLRSEAEESGATNAETAAANEQIAKQERDAADREKNNALAAREELRDTLYASEMNLIQAAGRVGNTIGSRSCSTSSGPRPARPTSADSSGTIGSADCSTAGSGQWKFRSLRRVRVSWLGHGASVAMQRGWRRLSVTPLTRHHAAGSGLLAIFDGVTGRELVRAIRSISRPAGQIRSIAGRLTMSDDGTRLAVA